jgi:predicted acylesterase/phospholipase RssA
LRRARRIARPERCGRIALLQGGGALEADQAGVYQALQEAPRARLGAGVSIGAINGAP